MIRPKATLAALVLAVALCGPRAASADTTLTIAGSTAFLPLAKAAAEVYQQLHQDVRINVSGGGSGVGITQVAQKAVDIGDSDIPAKGQPELVDHKVCVTAFALVVNPSAGVKNLTTQQVRDIFSGKATNWSQVGGANQKIIIVNRPRSSGTRATFVATVMGTAAVTESGIVEDANSTVVATVKNTPGATTYAAVSAVRGQSGITEVSLNGVAVSDENVELGKYPYWSYEHMFTNGPPSADASRFIAFVESRSDLVRSLGYIMMRDMRTLASDR